MTAKALKTRVRAALQINMHPFDAPHVVHTLPHQLRAWAGQVDRVAGIQHDRGDDAALLAADLLANGRGSNGEVTSADA